MLSMLATWRYLPTTARHTPYSLNDYWYVQGNYNHTSSVTIGLILIQKRLWVVNCRQLDWSSRLMTPALMCWCTNVLWSYCRVLEMNWKNMKGTSKIRKPDWQVSLLYCLVSLFEILSSFSFAVLTRKPPILWPLSGYHEASIENNNATKLISSSYTSWYQDFVKRAQFW